MKAILPCVNSGVIVWGISSCHISGPFVSTELFFLNATVYCCWPFLYTPHYTHLATSSRIMHHVTKLKSSQTSFLNMTISSLYSNGLHSHQISITFEIRWNGAFASRVYSRQICSNGVMLLCQQGPKSLRNVSNTLLYLCHK